MDFFATLERSVAAKGSNLCVGLDPRPASRPANDRERAEAAAGAYESNRRLIEATLPYTACYKPNLAFYEALGIPGWEALKRTLALIPADTPVILDAKRGDIDATATAYAEALFGELGGGAVTLSPYMGRDSVDPFLAWEGRGVFLLCRTSNPSSPVFQDIQVEGEPLYVRVARECSGWSDRVGLVVAGNDPDALARVRAAAPGAWFLSPGIGAQGGRADEALRAGARADGSGVLVMAARSVAGAADPGAAARALRDSMRAALRDSRSASVPASAAAGVPHVASSDPVNAVLKEKLMKALVRTGCFRLGDFVLKSGLRSPFYIDLRKLISDPEAMRVAGRAYASLARGLSYSRVAGIPAAGLPLATAASLELGAPMIWPRMPVKEHGTGNRVEGAFEKRETVLLLDDLITTGASKREAIDILRGEGLAIADLVVLIERGKRGRADMDDAGVRLHSFIHVREFFAVCESLGMIDSGRRAELEAFVDAE